MCDKLVFDLAQEIEGSPNIFVKKDWINILDDQNGNYGSNQSIISTSQLSNSNKYMSYREAYLAIPMVMTLISQTLATSVNFVPATAGTSADYSIGLKNWFGQIVHSLTLDYNGTTIIQQTPYVNMWNSFMLMTSLSYSDIAVNSASLGFYPDDSTTWSFETAASVNGVGTCNNTNFRPTGFGEVDSLNVKLTSILTLLEHLGLLVVIPTLLIYSTVLLLICFGSLMSSTRLMV